LLQNSTEFRADKSWFIPLTRQLTRDFVGKQAEESDAREHQSERAEKAGEARHEALLKEDLVDLLRLCADIGE
jgi:hypothetical protein